MTLSRENLLSLEDYSQQRSEFRARVLEHKRNRRVELAPHTNLYFEDALTMQYQIQEMLRIERIFEAEGIQEELDAYNPLIPDGSNWKATFMLEYDNPDERKSVLAKLIGVEDKVWVRVGEFDKVYAIADEDLERENEEKTSSVHFLRFELSADMVEAAKTGTGISMGVDHPELSCFVAVADAVRESLVGDLA
ncbi:MAG: DUF3501 family protein, partial [Gammaproteobacteria bacterium]